MFSQDIQNVFGASLYNDDSVQGASLAITEWKSLVWEADKS